MFNLLELWQMASLPKRTSLFSYVTIFQAALWSVNRILLCKPFKLGSRRMLDLNLPLQRYLSNSAHSLNYWAKHLKLKFFVNNAYFYIFKFNFLLNLVIFKKTYVIIGFSVFKLIKINLKILERFGLSFNVIK